MGPHLCADDLLGSRTRSHRSGLRAEWPVQQEVLGERRSRSCGVAVQPVDHSIRTGQSIYYRQFHEY